MQASDLAERFNLKVVAGKDGLDRQVTGGHCGDLLSEVMANAPVGCVWLTIQTHRNIIAVAVLKEMAAILLTGGNMPDADAREKADAEKIPVMVSEETTYGLAGKLYSAGVI